MIEQASSRMRTDHTLRKKNKRRAKDYRLHSSSEYKQANRTHAASRDRRQRNNPQSRNHVLAKLRLRIQTKMNTDINYRKHHQARVRQNDKFRMKAKKYREERKEKMRQHLKLRLQNDTKYREEHRSKMRAAYQNKQTRYDSSSTQSRAAKNYLARRTRLIVAARENSRTAMLQKKNGFKLWCASARCQITNKKSRTETKTWTKYVDSLSFKSSDKSYLLFGTVAS